MAFLRKAVSHPQLSCRHPVNCNWAPAQLQTTEQFLSPIAEAAATLLVEADFS